jgi:hypothetical protein
MDASKQLAMVSDEPETEEAIEHEAAREAMFAALARELNTSLGTAIADKTPIETRMLADEAQYWGTGDASLEKEDIVSGHARGAPGRGSTVDNKTRSKTRIASARIGDMLFPTNAPNWALRPSPYPDVDIDLIMEEYKKEQALNQPPPQQAPPPQQGMMGPAPDQAQGAMGGQPPPAAPPAAPQVEPNYDVLAQKVASRRCRKMTQLVRDALSENDYARAGRASIMDGCKVGTGILKGPYVRFQTKRSYETVSDETGSVAAIKVERVEVPGIARVSPWMFFPLRARCIEECEGSFELHILTDTQIRKMVKTHGFYPKQVSKLLKVKASLGAVESIMAKRAAITNYSMSRYDNSRAVWEYQGVIDGKVLRLMGFDIKEDDELTSFYGAVWFCDDIVVRIDMAPLEAESSLPYHVWCYEEDETNIFGFGVPFVMRDDQYVIDMIWTAILHNVSISSGPQIAIEKGVLIPADKSYHIAGPKLWYKNDVDVPMAQAFEVATIPSTVNTTMPVYQQALQNADSNTNLPLMLGDGGPGNSQNQGLSGMAQITVMNQTNIVQRQAAHAWDDNVTDRLITKLYHWFMESDLPEHADAKGDYMVEVRGASHLLVKDTQAQHAQLLLQMAAGDPLLAGLIHVDELYRIYLNFLDITIDGLMKTPEQVQADQANQQPDPVQEAEVRKLDSETALNEARAQSEAVRAQAEARQQYDVVDHAEIMGLELKYAELQDKERDREHQIQIELIKRETKLIEIASKEGLEYSKLESQVSSNREKMLADLSVKDTAQRSKDYFDAARLRLDQYNAALRAQNAAKGFDSFG